MLEFIIFAAVWVGTYYLGFDQGQEALERELQCPPVPVEKPDDRK